MIIARSTKFLDRQDNREDEQESEDLQGLALLHDLSVSCAPLRVTRGRRDQQGQKGSKL